MFTLKLDQKTERQVRTLVFRPYILSFLLGVLGASLVAIAATLILGSSYKGSNYEFHLERSDGWIIFTLFCGALIVLCVVAYYKIREDYRALVDDVLTPFRENLVGDWEVHWTNRVYEEKDGAMVNKEVDVNDYCRFVIDDIGKLNIISEINRSPIFEDWKRRIDDVSINLREKRLCFFDEAAFVLRKEVAAALSCEVKFTAKFFVILHRAEDEENEDTTTLKGQWYDLDGSFSSLRQQLAQLEHKNLPADVHFPVSGSIAYVKRPPATLARSQAG